MWDSKTEDINKIKKINMSKPIHDIINVKANERKRSLVVYEDGTCESLESALESKSEGKSHREVPKPGFIVENAQLTNGIFSYVKVLKHDKHFCYTAVDELTLKSSEKQKTFKLYRHGQDIKLMGSAVTFGNSKPGLELYTLWSDKRLFKQVLNPQDNGTTSIGTLHAIVESINAGKPLALTRISEDCLAIYASKNDDDGSAVIIYNLKYKIVQSKVPFKVYLANFKLWLTHRNILLALGEQLSVIPYRITVDELSSMVGSQCDMNVQAMVEKEMINEDLNYEENLVFDEDQTSVDEMEFKGPHSGISKQNLPLTKSKPIVSAEDATDQLHELYRKELVIDVLRQKDQAPGTVQVKLLSNVDEPCPLLSENFELFCNELEKIGCSETEVTDKIMPVLIKANRIEDMGVLLKRYNHVSERMLVKVVKYLLSCPCAGSDSAENNAQVAKDSEDKKICLSKKKFPNNNIFLGKSQSCRDVLLIALNCSFDSQTIVKFLRKEITLDELVLLMDELYKILSTNFLDDQLEMRGNLVEGNEFDYDAKLFAWMMILLDSHYQQILLSHDSKLHDKLNLWLSLVDKHIEILSEMNDIRQFLVKLSNKKQTYWSKKCHKWYSVEKLSLY